MFPLLLAAWHPGDAEGAHVLFLCTLLFSTQVAPTAEQRTAVEAQLTGLCPQQRLDRLQRMKEQQQAEPTTIDLQVGGRHVSFMTANRCVEAAAYMLNFIKCKHISIGTSCAGVQRTKRNIKRQSVLCVHAGCAW